MKSFGLEYLEFIYQISIATIITNNSHIVPLTHKMPCNNTRS